jgi:hypothetical protein
MTERDCARHVFAFEGRGGFPAWATPGEPTAPRRCTDAQGNLIPERGRFARAQVLNYWYDAVQAAGGCRWHYYAQNHWRRALADIGRVVSEVGPSTHPSEGRPAIVMLGYSNGGDAVCQVAGALDARGVAVDLVLTVDPVRKPLRGIGLLGFTRPANVGVWHNFYQRFDRKTFARLLPLVGRWVDGADTDRRLAPEDFSDPAQRLQAHIWIPSLPLIRRAITDALVALRCG